MYRTALATENYLAQDVKSVKAKKPCSKGRRRQNNKQTKKGISNLSPKLGLGTCKMLFTLYGRLISTYKRTQGRFATGKTAWRSWPYTRGQAETSVSPPSHSRAQRGSEFADCYLSSTPPSFCKERCIDVSIQLVYTS